MQTTDLATTTDEIQSIFQALVLEWRQDNRFVSSTHRMVLHPAYQKIIGLGQPAVPLLLEELNQKTGRWFWALKAITRQDPVPEEHRGRTKRMIKAWLEWGEQNGYR